MELAGMFQTLINSIIHIMTSFSFTLGGVTVNLWQVFCWLVLARFLIYFIRSMHGGD